ncbi:MAG: DUF2922 domain-containing protein [Tissierella sp.]|uniref:DUF2922 domain-containing protein n=1 Tax=Tissierella sp. TaxID=41274 RepID=UPI003F99C1A6
MIKKTLELRFLDGVNKRFRVSLADPKEDLSKLDIEDAMDSIIEKNIFKSNETDLTMKEEARIIETSTELIEF